ncbi:MAG: hypothetical protein ND895_08255 [Pyrinomonadaceae bacterium]|nr:hypothetical protein [Pyrinomonadaceae bacterium]
MKSLLLFIAFLCALTLTTSSAPPVTNAANAAQRERAVVQFTEPVTLMGETLKGEYLFVHDDAAMVRGDACTYIYQGNSDVPERLVVSFHCIPVPRRTVARFTVRTMPISPGLSVVTEYQFVGSSEAHLVPGSPHIAHVPIVPLD